MDEWNKTQNMQPANTEMEKRTIFSKWMKDLFYRFSQVNSIKSFF